MKFGANTPWYRVRWARARHEGGEAGDEVEGVEYDMSRSVTEGVLGSIHDLLAVIDREAFVRDCRAGDVGAQAFEGVPFMGLAARAGMEGESPELSDAGAVRGRVVRDGAQGQGAGEGMLRSPSDPSLPAAPGRPCRAVAQLVADRQHRVAVVARSDVRARPLAVVVDAALQNDVGQRSGMLVPCARPASDRPGVVAVMLIHRRNNPHRFASTRRWRTS